MTYTDDLTRQWGANIRKLREARGMSRAALARSLEMDQSTVWRIEHGYVAPHDQTRVRIAEVLGVRVEEIFTYPDTRTAAAV